MESRKYTFQETAVVAAGVGVGVGLMLIVFAVTGYFDITVLLGGLMGGFLSVANFFL